MSIAKKLKILVLHNRYQYRGGEDTVVEMETGMLSGHGHKVITYYRANSEINDYSLLQKLLLFRRTTWSSSSYNEVSKLCKQHQPDIAHFHNTLPLISPSAYYACRDFNVPIVQTLHNYRLICPSSLLMRDGNICEECLVKGLNRSFKYRCYRNSRIQTAAVINMLKYHQRRGTWQNTIDKYIALTRFAKNEFLEGGLPSEKIMVKSNFVDVPKKAPSIHEREGALFVGRVSAEKGIVTLLNAWSKIDTTLRIVGDGPLNNIVKESDLTSIEMLGIIDAAKVGEEMDRAAFLVMPSECYEGFPLVLAEAFAHGLPVIASRLGGMAEIVEDGVTGLHFMPGDPDDLVEKVNWMIDHPDEQKRMGENARRVYEEKYTPERNYEMLMEIYGQAINECQTRAEL